MPICNQTILQRIITSRSGGSSYNQTWVCTLPPGHLYAHIASYDGEVIRLAREGPCDLDSTPPNMCVACREAFYQTPHFIVEWTAGGEVLTTWEEWNDPENEPRNLTPRIHKIYQDPRDVRLVLAKRLP